MFYTYHSYSTPVSPNSMPGPTVHRLGIWAEISILSNEVSRSILRAHDKQNYGKIHHCSWENHGISTIIAIFHSYVSHCQRVYPITGTLIQPDTVWYSDVLHRCRQMSGCLSLRLCFQSGHALQSPSVPSSPLGPKKPGRLQFLVRFPASQKTAGPFFLFFGSTQKSPVFFSILMSDPSDPSDFGQAQLVRPLPSSLRPRRSSEYSSRHCWFAMKQQCDDQPVW